MMMTSRMAGKEPAHQIPSREDFLKLSEDQRNQINEAVSSDRSFSFPTGVPPMLTTTAVHSVRLG